MKNQTHLHSILQPSWRTIVLALAGALLSASLCTARADTFTWTGNASGYWGTSANWNHFPPATPGDGDDLVFPASPARLVTTNNLGARTFQSITISGIGYTLRGTGTGASITLTKGIRATYTGGSSAVDLNLQLGNSQTFTCRELGTGLSLRGGLNLAGHTLTVNVVKEGADLRLEGVVSGTGNLVKDGLGALIMKGDQANTYDGTTRIDAGSLTLSKSSGNAIPHGSLIIGDGLGGADADVVWETAGLQIGTIPITINSSGWLNLDAQNDMVGSLHFNGGRVSTSTGLLTLWGHVTVADNPDRQARLQGRVALSTTSTFNVTNSAFSPDLTVSATISGGGGILKTGSGALGLSAANTFQGPVTVRESLLYLYHADALGTTDSGTVVESGGVLVLANNTHVGSETLTLNGSGYGTSGALASVGGDNSWAGEVTLASDTVITVQTNRILNLSGPVTGSGGLTKGQPGSLIFSGASANTYRGNTFVNTGFLLLDKDGTDRALSGPGSLTIGNSPGQTATEWVQEQRGHQIHPSVDIIVNESGILHLPEGSDQVGAVTLVGGQIVTGTGTLTLGGHLTSVAASRAGEIHGRLDLGAITRVFDIEGTVLVYASISSEGDLQKIGSGVLTLAGANTHSGLTIVSNGCLVVAHGQALGATRCGTVVQGEGGLLLASVHVFGEPLALGNRTGYLGYAPLGVWGGTFNSWAGTITLAGDSGVYVPPGAFLDLPGPIRGRASFTKTGPGTLVFSGESPNTYSGETRVDEGTLLLAKTVWDVSIPGDLIIGDGLGGPDADVVRLGRAHQIARNSDVVLTNTGLLDLSDPAEELSGHAEGLDGLWGVGHVHLGTNTLAIGVDGASSTFDGTITDATPSIPAASRGETEPICGRLGKHGPGTFVLNGTNGCRGETIVWDGQLVVNGRQPFSRVGLALGTTLSGTGTVAGITSLGGTVSPGFLAPGTLTSDRLVMDTASTYHVDLAGQPPSSLHDQLNIVKGTIHLDNPGLTLNDAWVPLYGQRFVIINNESPDPIIGQFRDLPNGATLPLGPATYQIRYDGGDGNDVVLEVVATALEAAHVRISTGNGNGFVDPNECNMLHIVLVNTTASPITGIRAELTTSSPHVLLHQAVSAYPEIPPGGCATNLIPFQLSTLPTMPCGADIGLELTVTTETCDPFVVTPQLPLGPPGTPTRIDTDADLPIPDVGEMASTITVSGFDARLADVQLSIHLTHTAVGDLNLSLVGPDGTRVALSRGRGGTFEDYGTSCDQAERTWFGDSGALPIGEGTVPFLGLFQPEEPLAVFRGKHDAAVNGTWELRVEDTAAGTAGTLRCWSLFLMPPECPEGGGLCLPCPDQVIRGTITSSDPELRRVLVQDRRASVCGTSKGCPGTADLPRDRRCYYDAYTFQNGASNSCVTVEIVAPDSPGRLFSAAYRNRFDPPDPCANYLADSGSAGSSFYSFVVGPGEVFLVTVMDLAWSTQVPSYELRVSGGSCVPWLNIRPARDNKVILSWPTFASDFHLDFTNLVDSLPNVCIPVPGQPVVIGSAYTVTNSCTPPIRFYRLHKP